MKQLSTYLLNIDYQTMIYYLSQLNDDQKNEIINIDEIKNRLINPEKLFDFNFLIDSSLLPIVLDNKGIDILSKSDKVDNKLSALLLSNNNILEILFKNNNFLNLIYQNFNDVQYCFASLNEKNGMIFLEKISENNDPLNFIHLFSDKIQIEFLKKNKCHLLPAERYWDLVINLKNGASQMLLNNCPNTKKLYDLSAYKFFDLISKNVVIPGKLLHDPKFLNEITKMYDTYSYRYYMNILINNSDITLIDNIRQKYYDNLINSYDEKLEMISPLKEIYIELSDSIIYNIDYDLKKHFSKYDIYKTVEYLQTDLQNIVENKDLEKLKEYLINESNLLLSNIIIDYHFKDLYSNVLKDIKEICHFAKSTYNFLTCEKLSSYEQLLYIDNLNYKEKIELHKKLQEKDYVKEFYYDMRNARNLETDMIRDKILNKQKLKPFKNEELSLKEGVNIYTIDQPFYAMVKALNSKKNIPLSKNDIVYNVDGSSYSIDSSLKLKTFNNPTRYYNLLFNDFNKNQVVHVFPTDSYSYYRREYNNNGTNRIYKLLTPYELVTKGNDINEIVLSQKNDMKVSEMDQNILPPTPIAIYCYDSYNENDVISAKNLGIDIVVVDRKKFKKFKSDNQISEHDCFSLEYNYLDNINDDPLLGRKK